MVSNVSGVTVNTQGVTKPNCDKRTEFEQEKAYALQLAQGDAILLSQIEGIEPGKGALQQLEAIIASLGPNQQAVTSGLGPVPVNHNTLGVG